MTTRTPGKNDNGDGDLMPPAFWSIYTQAVICGHALELCLSMLTIVNEVS